MYSLPHRRRINNYFPAGYPSQTDISELEMVISNSTYQGGHGYLAGSFPGGITSVEGAPVSATIRVLLRVPGYNADGETVAEVQSSHDGTWIVVGINPNLKYDVVGRKEGFNDVIVAGVTPISMVDITYAGAVVENETFTGALGYLELVGGIPPYAASVVDPLPAGLFPVVDGHQLIIDGTTTDDDVFNSTVRITSSNGATKDVPVKLVVGFKAPANFEVETLDDAGTLSVLLTWGVTNTTQEVLVFKSATPFDLESMPAPIATLTGSAVSYTDDDVIEDDVFYYMAASVHEGFTLYSDEAMGVVGGDPHWDKVISLLYLHSGMTDETGATWRNVGAYTPAAFYLSGGPFDGPYARFQEGGYESSAALNVAAGEPITVEGWVRVRSDDPGTGTQAIVSLFKHTNHRFAYYHALNGSVFRTYHIPSTPNSTQYRQLTDNPLPADEWVFVAYVRDLDGHRVYFDGVMVNQSDQPLIDLLDSSIFLGSRDRTSVERLRGDIACIRITVGVARYTEDFTPPTKPFPNK